MQPKFLNKIDMRFKYTCAAETDVRKTWDKFRQQQKKDEKEKEKYAQNKKMSI
jgi:hypothetical protein